MARYALIITAVWIAATPARAQCPEVPFVENALRARLDRTALPSIVAPINALIPDVFEVPAEPFVISECDDPFDDNAIIMNNGTAAVHLRDLQIGFGDGELEVSARMDLEGSGDVDASLCGVPDANCSANLVGRDILISAKLEPSAKECTIDLPLTELTLDVDPFALEIQLSDCGIYQGLLDLVQIYFRDFLIDYMADEIGVFLEEAVAEALEAYTNELVSEELDGYGLELKAVPAALTVTPAGANIDLNVFASALDKPLTCLPEGLPTPDPPQGPFATLPALDDGAMVGVALSEAAIEHIIGAAWQAELLCIDTRALDVDLSEFIQGFMPGAAMHARAFPLVAPDIELREGGLVTLNIKRLAAVLNITMPDWPTSHIEVETSAFIYGAVEVDPLTRKLQVRIDGVRTSGVLVNSPDATVVFGEDNLRSLLDGLILPLFAEKVRRIPITGGLMVGAPVALSVDHIDTFGQPVSHVGAEFTLWPVDVDDTEPPMTIAQDWIPGVVGPQFVLDMVSFDAVTPTDLIRHRVVVNGEDDLDPFGATVRLTGLEQGPHNVSITAMDLTDNEDPTPLEFEIYVDATPPQVEIDGAPLGPWRGGDVKLSVRASDDFSFRQALRTEFEVTLVDDDPDVADEVLAAGIVEQGKFTVVDPPENQNLRVTVTVYDEVGNVGQDVIGFAVDREPNVGCAATPGGFWPLVFMLGLCIRRKRQ